MIPEGPLILLIILKEVIQLIIARRQLAFKMHSKERNSKQYACILTGIGYTVITEVPWR
jgi:hypothetical protein